MIQKRLADFESLPLCAEALFHFGGHFVASCERVKIDPGAWFRDVLARIATCPVNQLDQLLPHNWAAANQSGQIPEPLSREFYTHGDSRTLT